MFYIYYLESYHNHFSSTIYITVHTSSGNLIFKRMLQVEPRPWLLCGGELGAIMSRSPL